MFGVHTGQYRHHASAKVGSGPQQYAIHLQQPQQYCLATLQRSMQGFRDFLRLRKACTCSLPCCKSLRCQPHTNISKISPCTHQTSPVSPWHSYHTRQNSRTLQHRHTPPQSALGHCMQGNICPAGRAEATNQQASMGAGQQQHKGPAWLAELSPANTHVTLSNAPNKQAPPNSKVP